MNKKSYIENESVRQEQQIAGSSPPKQDKHRSFENKFEKEHVKLLDDLKLKNTNLQSYADTLGKENVKLTAEHKKLSEESEVNLKTEKDKFQKVTEASKTANTKWQKSTDTLNAENEKLQ